MVAREAILSRFSSYVGTRERTGSNDVVFADHYGITGQPWCKAMVQYGFEQEGAPLPHRSMYCPFDVTWARQHGEAVEVGEGDPIPGDIVYFSWDMKAWPRHRNGAGDHVGIVERWDGGDTLHTIEGNISPEGGGSQGVWRRRRSISGTVVCFWRPSVYDDSLEDPDVAFDADMRRLLEELHGSRGMLTDVHAHLRLLVDVHAHMRLLRDLHTAFALGGPDQPGFDEIPKRIAGFAHEAVGGQSEKLAELVRRAVAGEAGEPAVERVVDVDASLQLADAQQLMAALMVRLGQQKAS